MKLREIFKNEYVQTVVPLIIVVIGTFTFWFGLRMALNTERPLLAVASESMEPTLYKGDLIVVRGVDPAEIIAAPAPDGDIIVFHKPNTDELIVHRAVSNLTSGGILYFQTKGDNTRTNPGTDPWIVSQNDVVGKVVWRVQWLGHITLFVRTPAGMLVMVLLFVLILFVDYIPFLGRREA